MATFRLKEDTHTARAFQDYLAVFAVMVGITLPALFLRSVAGPSSIALLYLLSVVLLALFVGRGPTLLAAAISGFSWDYFFLSPITKFRIANTEDVIMLGIYFVVAIVIGLVTTRMTTQQKAARQEARRLTSLYQMSRDLLAAMSLDETIEAIVRHMENAFQAPTAILLADSAGRLSYHAHPASSYDIAGPEQPIAEWAFEHAKPAGRFASHLAKGEALFVPLVVQKRSIGVMALKWPEDSVPNHEQANLLEHWARDIALSLDRDRFSACGQAPAL